MGYRSDVKIALYVRRDPSGIARGTAHPMYGALKLWFDENWPKYDDYGEMLFYPEEGAILVSYMGTKWYDGYEEVRAVQAAMEKFQEDFLADDKEGVGSCEFVRVGEDDHDIEAERSDWNDYRLGVSREIVVDFGGWEQ
jgi:hypothetical protein